MKSQGSAPEAHKSLPQNTPAAGNRLSVNALNVAHGRLFNLDNGVFERLGRYESAIARQVLKTLYLLQSVRVS